jgi:hypothetical protein
VPVLFQLSPTFPRNNLGNVVLGFPCGVVGDTKESVWILQAYRSRFTLGFGFLVFWWCIDDSMHGFDLLFQLRYGSFLESFGSHELGLFNCLLLVFASVFSFFVFVSFTASLSSNIHCLLFTAVLSLHLTTRRSDYPSHASVSFFDLRKPQSGATHGRLRLTRLFFWSHCLEIPLEHSHGAWS